MTTATSTRVRWLIRADMPQVLEIEQLCFRYPWPEEQFIEQLRRRNVIGKGYVQDNEVLGFAIYEVHKRSRILLDLAVHPSVQRRGVGRTLVENLQENCGSRRTLVADVAETNLDGHLFFKAVGFRAVAILPARFEVDADGNQVAMPAYRFVWDRRLSDDD